MDAGKTGTVTAEGTDAGGEELEVASAEGAGGATFAQEDVDAPTARSSRR